MKFCRRGESKDLESQNQNKKKNDKKELNSLKRTRGNER